MKIKIDPLDKMFSQYVKLRDQWCQRCGGTTGLQAAHFYSRRKRQVRYDPDNACLLCFGCHSYLDSNPLEKIEFFQKRLGEGFELLQARERTIGKVDKEAVRLFLLEQIKLLGGK
tara:strand:- start:1442 stop:1786 length:345 start_codon:yes stop_codon:yes gene_type:complete